MSAIEQPVDAVTVSEDDAVRVWDLAAGICTEVPSEDTRMKATPHLARNCTRHQRGGLRTFELGVGEGTSPSRP